jgi:hypothetical protein
MIELIHIQYEWINMKKIPNIEMCDVVIIKRTRIFLEKLINKIPIISPDIIIYDNDVISLEWDNFNVDIYEDKYLLYGNTIGEYDITNDERLINKISTLGLA